ncbi:BrnT family toxin [Acidicapsa ligni]|uniref:BrnT family toxin n=1 Tax=Acidicapsa ligni TaxID=542300 RepID=UPI0021E0790F|nr:BrnT family toxin [Acidicapsa ligni]
MDFEWDPQKAEANLRKHSVSFAFATNVFLDPHRIERIEDAENYGEIRESVIGRHGEFILVVIYTMRQAVIRIISARRATRHEHNQYWND